MSDIDLKRGVDFVGITCVFFCHDGKGNVLLHKRSNNCRDEKGNWDCGGGALELGESWENAAKREIKEEYCVDVVNCKFAGATNVLRKNGDVNTHWVALLFSAQVNPDEVKIGEPDKIDEIGWFSDNNLPFPLHSQFLRHYEDVKKAGLI